MNGKARCVCAKGLPSMSHHHHNESGIFIKEAEGHQRRYHKIVELTHSTTKAAGVMLLGAIIALIVANTAFHEPFYEFWHTEVSLGFGSNHVEMSLAHIINDILMAIFFLLVGLEIKYEMTVGELTNIRQAILPVGAALGGVMMPIVVYLIFNAGNPETMMGWGVPTATDIAFALGILALLGSRVPAGVRVFLSTLAVADDIVAIIVIAVFYGQSPSAMWLGAALVVLIVLALMNKSHIYSLLPYLLVGAVLWYCIFMSGVHSTIAGVLLAFVIPSGSRVDLKSFADWSGERVKEAHETFEPNEPVIGQADYLASVTRLERVARHVVPPATRLERKLYPWVYFAILPLFALTNADVAFTTIAPGDIVTNSVFLGVFFGLIVGKPLGIMLMSFIVVKSKLSTLPENVNWVHLLGAALLGGVGFTMAIFVANLAFVDPEYVMIAKVAILAASLVAGVAGFAFLFIQAKAATLKGIRFEAKIGSPDNLQTFGAQVVQRRYERELEYANQQIAKNQAEIDKNKA